MGKYLIYFKVILPFSFKKLFFVVQLGKNERLKSEGSSLERRKNSNGAIFFASFTVVSWFVTGGLILLFITLYLLKNYLGINLVEHAHPVPEFLKSIGLCR